jgi:3-oxoacyl-[acyl-carrier-protein] synthase II
MSKKRIVVTGLGVVSCFGNDVEEYYRKLLAGESGVRTLTKIDPDGYTTRFGGEICDFTPEPYMDKKQARRADKFIAYTVVAGKKSLESAQLTGEALEKINKRRAGVIIGSGMGGMDTFYEGCHTFLEKGFKRISPFFVPHILTNMGGGILAMEVGFMGPNYSISTACATGNNAIISAANHIRNGEADIMITGGAEAALSHVGLIGFMACRALSTRNEDPAAASRPWDKGRDGFVMGEGAGVLVLESLEHALERGAPILAEYLGGGVSCDAYHFTEPHPEGKGVIYCLENALANAGVSEGEVNFINAHATSTPAGDMAEIKAFKKTFSNTKKITVNATKSMIGHGLGAAGGLEAVALVKAIETGMVHPTINLTDPEDGILDFDVPTVAVKRDIQVGVSTSFGFGGHNAAIVMGKYVG